MACRLAWMLPLAAAVTHTRRTALRHAASTVAAVAAPARAKELFPRGFVEIRRWFRLAPSPNMEVLSAATEALKESSPKKPKDRKRAK